MPPKSGRGISPIHSSVAWLRPDGVTPATPAFLQEIQDEVVRWWVQHHRRDLPWRPHRSEEDCTQARPDPYAIWVSEVMSQQTRMDTVIRYFPTWMATFPTIERVAAASEDDVRRVWAGLGFYRRAMLLHRGAQFLVKAHGDAGASCGEPVAMPGSYQGLLKVPGIGPYTAAAIASVCFHEPVAAVDGNVIRVLSRLRGERAVDPKSPAAGKAAQAWAQALMLGSLDTDATSAGGVCAHPGALNQGLMELGASVCRPAGSPLCEQCPLRSHCAAFALHQRGDVPAIEGVIPLRGSKAKVRHDTVVCVVHEMPCDPSGERRFVIVKRPDTGLLGGMLEFPCVTVSSSAARGEAHPGGHASSLPASGLHALQRLAVAGPTVGQRPVEKGTVRHVFSHIDMLVHVYHVRWEILAEGEQHGECGRRSKSAKARKATAPPVHGARDKGEVSLCCRLADALDAEENAHVIGGDTSDETVVVSSDSESERDDGSPKGRQGKKKKAVAPKNPLSPTRTIGRVSIMTEAELVSAAPSRLCLKILRHVFPSGSDGQGLHPKQPRTSSPPRKAARK